MSPGVIPLEALLDDTPGPRESLRAADVVVGVGVTTERRSLVFGRPVLEEIARTGQARGLRIVSVGVDEGAGDLELLAALVREVKGRGDGEAAPA